MIVCLKSLRDTWRWDDNDKCLSIGVIYTLIEKDHLGDWSPEKEVLTTCAKAILTLKMASD